MGDAWRDPGLALPPLSLLKRAAAVEFCEAAVGVDSIEELIHYGFEAQFVAQLALPATLHRAYWRRRANPRLHAQLSTGSPRDACAVAPGAVNKVSR